MAEAGEALSKWSDTASLSPFELFSVTFSTFDANPVKLQSTIYSNFSEENIQSKSYYGRTGCCFPRVSS